MTPTKAKSSISTVFHLCLAAWIVVLSVLVFKNMSIIGGLQNDASTTEHNVRFESLEAQVSKFSEQLVQINRQQDFAAMQFRIDRLELDYKDRMAQLDGQLSGVAMQADISQIKEQLQQQILNELQSIKAAAAVQTTATPAPASKPQPVRANPIPPFKVLGVELRGGRQLLSVISTEKDSSDAVALLAVGGFLGNWQLEAIEGDAAVFKTGAQTHRIRIP